MEETQERKKMMIEDSKQKKKEVRKKESSERTTACSEILFLWRPVKEQREARQLKGKPRRLIYGSTCPSVFSKEEEGEETKKRRRRAQAEKESTDEMTKSPRSPLRGMDKEKLNDDFLPLLLFRPFDAETRETGEKEKEERKKKEERKPLKRKDGESADEQKETMKDERNND